MNIVLTKKSLDWFESKNISFDNRFGSRLKEGDKVNFLDVLEVEPYVGFHMGNNLFEQGFMSYSNSNLPIDIKLGRYCSLAWGLHFISYNHPWKCLSTNIFSHNKITDLTVRTMRDFLPEGKSFNFVPNPQKKQVIIENDVWIGQMVSLLAGIKIGTGSIVAANSVVTRDVEPYSIVGGNPAKVIKYRFPKETIDKLLEIKWWEYKYTDFYDLDISDPDNFINQFEMRKVEIEKYCPEKILISEALTL